MEETLSTQTPGRSSKRVRRLKVTVGLLVLVCVFTGLAFGANAPKTRTSTVSFPVCGTWTVSSMQSAGLFAGNIWFGSVSAVSSDDVWAFGESSEGTLIQHWDGARWGQVDSPTPSGKDVEHVGIYDSVALATDDVWAVGVAHYPNQTFILHWEGSRWSMVPHPNIPGARFSGIHGVSNDDVWIVGYYRPIAGEETLVMHWDGLAWSVVPSPNSPDVKAIRNELQAVFATGPDDAWGVGHYVTDNTNNTGGAYTLTLHWDGKAWNVVPSPNPCKLVNKVVGVAMRSPTDVWAVGSCSNDEQNAIYENLVMHWDGREWSLTPTPKLALDQGLGDVTTTANGEAWAVGHYGDYSWQRTQVLYWDRKAWRHVPIPSPHSFGTQGTGKEALANVVAWKDEVWAVGSSWDPHRAGIMAHLKRTKCPNP